MPENPAKGDEMLVKIGKAFELELRRGLLYLKLGARDWCWTR